MLNELYTLYRCLKKCGIPVDSPHQDVKTPGKSEGFVVGVNINGMPETLEYVSADKMAKLWTLRKGKQNSFPYVKLKKPILASSTSDGIHKEYKAAKKYEDKKTLLGRAINDHQLNDQNISLAKWTKEQINAVKVKDGALKAIEDLVARLPCDQTTSMSFMKKTINQFLECATEQNIDLVKTIMFGVVKKEKIVCDGAIFFDVSDWHKYPVRVACREMGLMVGKNLPPQPYKNGVSVFGGTGWQSSAYPDPTLPAVGIAYLFSMNDDAGCQNKYGKEGSNVFHVSPHEIVNINGALQWCVAEERKGKTWHGVPNISRKQDLVISYLEDKPQAEIELAGAFSSFDVSEEETSEVVYEAMVTKVCDALKGEKGLTRDSRMNLFVITKVDEGRAQVVLSDSYSIGNIMDSLEEWWLAAKNHPYFAVFIPGKKGEKAKLIEPFCPSPFEVMKCLQNQWIKNGLDKRDVPGVALRQVYDLFLGDGRASLESARMFLQLTLQRLGSLIAGIAGADHVNDARYFNEQFKDVEPRRTVLIGISLLSIVLHKLEIKKEAYMKEAAFNLGRLLSLADSLHAQYCKAHMKDKSKDLPPQLLGNAHLPRAFDNPDKALALLGERLRIYYAWATQVQGDQYKLVKWLQGQMGEISDKLNNVTWPLMADDAIKAQILLGYLARSKSDEK